MKKVSIIIPVYNSEKYIGTAIESVLQQDYENFELLLVNDGSTDSSEQICKRFAEQDKRVRYFYKENGGVCSARNYGLKQATGDYLCLVDNDDVISPHLLSDNVKLLEENDADIVKFEKKRKEYLDGVLQKEIDSDGISKLGVEQGKTQMLNQSMLKEKLYTLYRANLMMYIWNGLYRMSVIKDNNLKFNEDFKNGHEDILMNMQCYRHARKIILNNEVYYTHNWRVGKSASTFFTPNRINDAIVVANYEKELFADYGYSNDILLAIYMDNLFLCLNIISLAHGSITRKEQNALLDKFHENMNHELQDVKKIIPELARIDKIRAILAFFFQHKFYSIVRLLYILYTMKNK